MPEPPTKSARHQHECVLELAEGGVEDVIAQADHRAQQAAVEAATDEGGRLDHRDDVGARSQSGQERLVQCFRHTGFGDSLDNLLDVERHAVAAFGNRRPVICRETRIQGGDQGVGLVIGQRLRDR